jgi:sulfotransferase
MPRSGSTLLANVLNQNPVFRATPTSGLCTLLLQMQNFWNEVPELKASATAEDKLSTLRGLLHGFHGRVEQPVIFDKSRAWTCAYELLENLLGYAPKVIVTIRDIPSILSSCEKLFRKELSSPNSVAKWGNNMETIEGRLAFWSDSNQLVGSAYNRIRDCVMRGHRKSMHFINFDRLTTTPRESLQSLYAFLGEPYFEGHNFDSVEQSTHEKDEAHGFVDLHTIRKAIRPVKKDFREVLGDAVKPYLKVDYDFLKQPIPTK